MIGNLIYLAALNAPEIASAAGDISGGLIEAVGRRLAAGMSDEIGKRLDSTGGKFFETALTGIRGLASSAISDAQASLSTKLADALGEANASLVANEELELLREIAAAAASNSDTSKAIERLKKFHQNRAGAAER